MADADPAGTLSTPSTAASVADPAPATAPVAEPVKEPVTTDPVQPTEVKPAESKPAEAKPADVKPDAPLFVVPEDAPKFAPEAITSLETFLKGKLVDGKLNLSAQDVFDALSQQGLAAHQRWEAMQVQQDRAWEATSKQRFTAAQLAAAEAGVGFITSKQVTAAEKAGHKDAMPFRDLAKGFRNHPDFVQAMAIIGDSLNEDTFEHGGHVTAKKSPAERLYPGLKPS